MVPVSKPNFPYFYQYVVVPGAEETFVFFHNIGLCSSAWEPLLPYLKDCNVLFVDLPGHGQTPPQRELITLKSLCKDIALLFEWLNIRQAHLVGHGFGATLAVRYAWERSDLTASVILFSTFTFYPSATLKQTILQWKSIVDEGGMDLLAAHVVPLLTKLPSESSQVRKLTDIFRSTDADNFFTLMEIIARSEPVDDFGRLEKPALILAGEDDILRPPYLSAISASFSRQSQFVTVQDAGNISYFDNPKSTSEKIFSFLDKIRTDELLQSNKNPLLVQLQKDVAVIYSEGLKEVDPNQRLIVRLLGKFRVYVNQKEINEGWNQRQAKRLLLYLLFHPGCTREDLYDEFWPELELKKAQNNLRVSLNHLKNLLEPKVGNNYFLEVDRGHIFLTGRVDCDLIDFIVEMDQALSEKKVERKEKLARSVWERTPPVMLAGSWDEWILRMREDIENKLMKLGTWLLRYLNEKGLLDDALYYANKMLPYSDGDPGFFDLVIAISESGGYKSEASIWRQRKRQILAQE